MRLVGNDAQLLDDWHGRAHFFAAAAEAMRRILIENARRKKTEKRSGKQKRRQLIDQPELPRGEDLLALDEALNRLAEHDSVAAHVVELRYFAGLGHEEIASSLNLTVYRARQKWTYARAWLRRELSE